MDKGEKGKGKMREIKNYRELNVYQSAITTAIEIFKLSREFPDEERYSLTSQIRRSSRSVCANLAEAWRKRRYTAAFVAKISDAEAEAAETQVHAEIAWRCGYVSEKRFLEINETYEHILAQLVRMASQPKKWVPRSSL